MIIGLTAKPQNGNDFAHKSCRANFLIRHRVKIYFNNNPSRDGQTLIEAFKSFARWLNPPSNDEILREMVESSTRWNKGYWNKNLGDWWRVGMRDLMY